MTSLKKNSITVACAVLLFLVTGIIPYAQQQLYSFNVEAEGSTCVNYDQTENKITIDCDASFVDVVQTINDPDVIENLGNGDYILDANIEVADGVTFEITSNGIDNLQYLKIAGENGIIVYGKIVINGVTITSWDVSDDDIIQQNINGTIPRGYIQFAASEGSQIINSEFGYLGYVEPGRRGFDLFGDGPSHDMLITGSKFHDMWMAFYSNGAYNVKVDGNEYYNNIKYSLDPHTTTHDMKIINNWIHNNPIGPICSDRCWDILIDGNVIQDTANAAIFFSRNMTDSIARNNHVINARTGIVLSESPNNQVYNNIIEGATEGGILLYNPDLLDDGSTTGNIVYNNIISNSENGIRATRTHDNTVQNNTFSEIESREYRVLGDSSITIRGQHFDNTLIAGDDSQTGNLVEIADSGTIQVTDGASDDDDDEQGGGGALYNTDNEPYRTTLSDGDSITVNSPS
jgi:parallel beta-helix repeat protein